MSPIAKGRSRFTTSPASPLVSLGKAEDDGYLVTIAWDQQQQRSEVQVFDASGREFGRGPIARVPLPRRVPHGFHATFVSAAVLQRWK